MIDRSRGRSGFCPGNSLDTSMLDAGAGDGDALAPVVVAPPAWAPAARVAVRRSLGRRLSSGCCHRSGAGATLQVRSAVAAQPAPFVLLLGSNQGDRQPGRAHAAGPA